MVLCGIESDRFIIDPLRTYVCTIDAGVASLFVMAGVRGTSIRQVPMRFLRIIGARATGKYSAI